MTSVNFRILLIAPAKNCFVPSLIRGIFETGAGGHDLSLNEVAAMRIICTNPTTAPKMRPAR